MTVWLRMRWSILIYPWWKPWVWHVLTGKMVFLRGLDLRITHKTTRGEPSRNVSRISQGWPWIWLELHKQSRQQKANWWKAFCSTTAPRRWSLSIHNDVRLQDFFSRMFKVQKHEQSWTYWPETNKDGKERDCRSPGGPVKICEDERCLKGGMECSRATCRAWWGRCNDVPMCHCFIKPSYFLAGATNALCVSQEVQGLLGLLLLLMIFFSVFVFFWIDDLNVSSCPNTSRLQAFVRQQANAGIQKQADMNLDGQDLSR